MSITRHIVLGLLSLVVLMHNGCSDRVPEYSDTELLSIPVSRVSLPKEWRDAHLLPDDAERAYRLRAPAGATHLRLGVLGGTDSDSACEVQVYWGEEAVISETCPGGTWRDLRVPAPETGESDVVLSITGGTGVALGPVRFETGSPPGRPNVLVIMVDTLRRDRLGCYGYDMPTSPNADALAEDGIRYTRAIPQSSWTRPAVASLLTSRYPQEHGGIDRQSVVREDWDTIASVLSREGYETQGFISNPNCLPDWGFGAGFARYVDIDSRQWRTADDADVVDEAVAAIDHLGMTPWFLYVHLMSPHNPYAAHPEYGDQFARPSDDDSDPHARARELYDGEIRYADDQIGRLLAHLKQMDRYDDTLIIFTSDHGEAFGEHGHTHHGSSLYQEQVEVPLIVKLPGNAEAGAVDDRLVELVDMPPTILSVLDLPEHPDFKGISALGGKTRTYAYTSLHLESRSLNAAYRGSLKLIRNRVTGEDEWFDLASDPDELDPIDQPPEGGRDLAQHVDNVSALGLHGLHVLVTSPWGENHTVEVNVAADEIANAQLRHIRKRRSLHEKPNAVSFEMTFGPGDDEMAYAANYLGSVTRQVAGRFIANVPPDAPVSISVRADGQRLPVDQIRIGPNMKQPDDSEFEVVPGEIAAEPSEFNEQVLPVRFAAYVFYVPQVTTDRSTEDIDPEMREALEGLGYL